MLLCKDAIPILEAMHSARHRSRNFPVSYRCSFLVFKSSYDSFIVLYANQVFDT